MDIKTPAANSQSAAIMPSTLKPELLLILQSFPYVADQISRLWGSADLQEYLGKTIFDERGGRQGFPAPVVMALERIFENHSKLFPQKNEDPFWESMSR